MLKGLQHSVQLPGGRQHASLQSGRLSAVRSSSGKPVKNSSQSLVSTALPYRKPCPGVLPVSRPSRNVATAAHEAIPSASGLFNPENDKDACGVGECKMQDASTWALGAAATNTQWLAIMALCIPMVL